MLAQHYRPGPPLGGFVDCLWYFRGYTSPHARERALPTGTVELVINLQEDPIRIFSGVDDEAGQQYGRAVVCGPHSGYFVLNPQQQDCVIGVHFRPGGAAPFLGLPAGEVTNQHVALTDIWGAGRTDNLRQRLLAAADPAVMFAVLEEALLARLKPPLLPHPAVAHALRKLTNAPALSRISTVQDEAGYSAKRFIELFRGSVGLTPKVYCRVRRFQAVIDRLARGGGVEWAAIAADSGYADQSHLNT